METIAETLIAHDSDAASQYRERADQFQQELDELNAYCQQQAAKVPQSERWLITSHDAFNYYGRAYGFDVVGI